MSIPSQEQVALLTDFDENSAYSKAYQMLYANISFSWNETQHKSTTIAFMTPSPTMGQAAAAANIAIVAAQNGTPTIIVDADLRTSTLQQRFGVSANVGLSDLLTQKTYPSASSFLCETFVPGLSLLSAGTVTQRSLHVHDLAILRHIVEDLQHTFDKTDSGLIVFNCPSVLSSPDATLISSLVDQVFLLIVSGKTTRRQAKQAQEQLQHAHATLAGVVMLDM